MAVPGKVSSVIPTPSEITSGKLFVAWTSATGASSYAVTLFSSGGTFISTLVTTATITDFSGLTTGASYYVVVEPYNNDGYGVLTTSPTVTMPVINTRPDDWQWSTLSTAGTSISIDASDWNGFTSRINEFREHKGKGFFGFSLAYANTTITASQYNEARLAISAMGAVPHLAVIGNEITVTAFTALRDSLNAIN